MVFWLSRILRFSLFAYPPVKLGSSWKRFYPFQKQQLVLLFYFYLVVQSINIVILWLIFVLSVLSRANSCCSKGYFNKLSIIQGFLNIFHNELSALLTPSPSNFFPSFQMFSNLLIIFLADNKFWENIHYEHSLETVLPAVSLRLPFSLLLAVSLLEVACYAVSRCKRLLSSQLERHPGCFILHCFYVCWCSKRRPETRPSR